MVFADPFAQRIIGARARAILARHPRRFERGVYPRYLRSVLAVRSRVAEETLADAVARGVRQYVVLGAGLDTFALRNPHDDLRVFEVDHPLTQGWKRRLLADEGLTPRNLSFVPVDFTRQSLEHELLAAGLDPAAPAFFSWLGVVPYLEPAAIRATLSVVARRAGEGGGIAFDFLKRPGRREWLTRAYLWYRARKVARLGEPFRTFPLPDEMEHELRDAGFCAIEILTPEFLNATYFTGRTDGLRVRHLTYLARARGPAAPDPSLG